MNKVKVAILGPGNIGTDLMFKVFRSKTLEMGMLAGIVESEGIQRARDLGVPVSIQGIQGVLESNAEIVFDATSAAAHYQHAPLLRRGGKIAIDLTPAAVGPYMVPVVNLDSLQNETNINLVTCGGQATIPIVKAVERVAGAQYAEIVASIASLSAGPGTRANIDEFTETTAKAIQIVGGADRGKAIIILNPADPPLIMSNTVYVTIKDPSVPAAAITESVERMVKQVQEYVPGYRLRVPPILDGDQVTVRVEVEGAGDFLPAYSGNLDIITSAAVKAAETFAERFLTRKHLD